MPKGGQSMTSSKSFLQGSIKLGESQGGSHNG
jgi:hypothetical protein